MRCQPQRLFQVYNWLFNDQTCLLCDERSDLHLPICEPCLADLPWLRDACPRCALPMPLAGLTCSACSHRAPAFEDVVIAWQYDFPIDALVTRFKHRGQWPIGRLLADLLAQQVLHRFEEGLERPDVLIPVPLGKRRLRQRGYNQAAMLARWLGGTLEAPVLENLLLRTRETAAQQNLNANERRRNLRGAFSVQRPERIEGRHVTLVDDVMTTGSTANILARLLRDAGARRVDLYCLARTPAPATHTER